MVFKKMTDKNEITQKGKGWQMTRTAALISILKQSGKPMRTEDLVAEAQKLHPLSNPWNYREWMLRKKEIFTLFENSEVEHGGLTEWLKPPKSTTEQEEEEDTSILENEIPLIYTNPEKLILQSIDPYIDVNNELNLAEAHLKTGRPLLKEGVAGIGKTLGFAYFAFKKQIPILQFDCSPGTRRKHLIGQFTVVGNTIKFILGALPDAIMLANAKGEAIISFEELTSLEPEMQKVLNQLLDHRKHVFIPELNRIFKLNPGAKLLIGATANPSFYGGVFEMNEDLKSRFSILRVGYPPEDKEREIISLRGDVSERLMEMILAFTRDTRAGAKENNCAYAISPRDIHQFIDNLRSYENVFDSDLALEMALTTSFLGKYDDEKEQDFIKARIYDSFMVRI